MKRKTAPKSKTLRQKIESLDSHFHCNECDPYGFYGSLVEREEVLRIVREEEESN